MNTLRKSALATLVVLLPCVARGSLLDGLVAHYNLDGDANDSSGYGNDGTVFGATPSADRFGTSNSAFSFNGIDNYIHIPESTAFDSTAFSISVWFRAASYPVEAGMLISKGQNNFEIHTASEETGSTGMKFLPRFIAQGVVTDWHSPADSYALGEWTHVVGVYDPGNAIAFFVDGVEVPLIGPAATPSLGDNLLDARLGMRTDDTLAFHGDMDDVRIYDRVLSAAEVEQLFSAVPEPSSLLLAAFGLAGLAAWSWRRSKPESLSANP